GDITQTWRVQCEALRPASGINPSEAEPGIRWDGAWIQPVPSFPEEHRVHVVIFAFPRTDNTTLALGSPEGFEPAETPPPVMIQTPLGSYTRFVQATPGGYEIQRSFTLAIAEAGVEEYPQLRQFLLRVHQADETPLKFKPMRKPE